MGPSLALRPDLGAENRRPEIEYGAGHPTPGTQYLIALLPYCPIALLPYCPIALLPYCPIALLPYCHPERTVACIRKPPITR
jgi:hypothetical protein